MTTRLARRPMAQIEQLRSRAYEVAPGISRRLLRAQNGLTEEQLKMLKDRRFSAYVSGLIEYQASADIRIILDWLVGEGLNDPRYRKYFTDNETEDVELFLPAKVEQPEEFKKAVSTIDTLRRDERYDLHNIAGRDYTEDTVDHIIRRFWGTVSSASGKDDELYSMYIDISSAIDRLTPSEKRVVQLLSDGWSFRDLQVEHHISTPKKIYQNARKNIVAFLTKPEVEEEHEDNGQASQAES